MGLVWAWQVWVAWVSVLFAQPYALWQGGVLISDMAICEGLILWLQGNTPRTGPITSQPMLKGHPYLGKPPCITLFSLSRSSSLVPCLHSQTSGLREVCTLDPCLAA